MFNFNKIMDDIILINKHNIVSRSVKLKKNNKKIINMTPNIKLHDSNEDKKLNIQNQDFTQREKINLIKDSDSESVSTLEPSSPIKKKEKKTKEHKSLPEIDNDEFSYFTNTKKQKPIINQQNNDDEDGDEYGSEYESEENDNESSDDESGDEGEEPSVAKGPKMNKQEIERKKQEILVKLMGLEKKGVVLTKTYSLRNNLDELEYEYEIHKKAAELEASVHFQQKILMAAVTGVEFLNKKFDPIGAKLEGWSESVMDGINDYEEIFKELHEKYSGEGQMPPELRLLVTLVGSGFMFHLTNSLFKSATIPGIDSVLKSNPNIMKDVMGAMGSMMNQQQQVVNNNREQQSIPGSVDTFPKMNLPTALPTTALPTTNRPSFTGPSVNLANLMNDYTGGPPPPISQKAPKQMPIDDDRFSEASYSDYSVSESKTISVSSSNKKPNKKFQKNKKSIKI